MCCGLGQIESDGISEQSSALHWLHICPGTCAEHTAAQTVMPTAANQLFLDIVNIFIEMGKQPDS